ncbi:MAG: HEAT repeat domain-containing protein, partial [Candidatus Riflebacteria bacterium]|nr:HEAT repeat domain-containing protein [Candidatus Riflebacteria bacterium]
YVRSSVAYALGTTSELRAMHALFECASDDSEVVRFSAAKAVASFPVDEVMHEVSLRLEKGDRSARMSLLEILGHVKDDRAVRILKNYLANEDSELSYRASISLMAQDNPDNVDIIDELIAASKRLDTELRKIAQENVITRNDNGSNNQGQAGKTGENLLETFKDLPPNLEKLRQALLDKSPNIRGSAANTLGDFDSPDALALLAAALHDENEFVRASVVTSLGKIASEVAIEVITQAEKDSSEEVRYAIVKAVGSSRTLAGRECLGRMSTSDKSKNVKRAARLALEKLASD